MAKPRKKKAVKVRRPMPPPSRRHKDRRDKAYREGLVRLYNEYIEKHGTKIWE
jgi:hypothetical protein